MLGFLTVSTGAYWYINRVIKEELSESMLVSVGKSAESINSWLKTIMIEPEIVATTPVAKNINKNFRALDGLNTNRYVFLRGKYPHLFQDIYAANSKGEYHTVQEKDGVYSMFIGDIANRPYFLSIMAGSPTQITPPLISRTTGIPTIFMVSPIVDDDNKPQGLIGAGLSLQYIQQIARALKAGKSGYGFLIAQDGTYIYHPNGSYILQNSINALADETRHELGGNMLSGESGTFRFMENNRKMVAFYHPIPIAGWSIAKALPAAELFAPATRLLRVLVAITVAFLGIIVLTIFFVAARLTTPLRDLAIRAKDIAAGKMNLGELPVDYHDEVGMVAEAFNFMTKNLEHTMTNLRESEDKYRGFFENAVEGIFQSSLNGKLMSCNPACKRMFALPQDSEPTVLYRDLQHQIYVNPVDRDVFIQLLSEHGEVRDFEVQLYRYDGDVIWASINASLIRDENDMPRHIEGLMSDITERKKVEEEREKLQHQLVQAQKLEAVGQLAGGVAHDFNNMLAVILGLTELALLKTRKNDPLRNTFVEIRKAASHSADLTRQLLTFARKQTVSPKVLDLNDAIENTLNMLRRLIGEDITLTTSLDNNLWPVFIDPGQLSQILTNLCVNARDAIPGIGTIMISTGNMVMTRKNRLDVPDARPGDFAFLAVADNGKGMEPETRNRIFEPFFTTQRDGRGTGLGLATVYGIVKQNEAFIDIDSSPGIGTTMRIFFPRSVVKARQGGLENSGDIQHGMETVLLVEDEPELLKISEQMLKELGYKVIATLAPAEALRLAVEHREDIDILMTDVIMPTMNGRDLSRHVRTILPDVKCLFISGYTSDIITTRSVLGEGVNFLAKPFTLEKLAEKIRQVYDGKV